MLRKLSISLASCKHAQLAQYQRLREEAHCSQVGLPSLRASSRALFSNEHSQSLCCSTLKSPQPKETCETQERGNPDSSSPSPVLLGNPRAQTRPQRRLKKDSKRLKKDSKRLNQGTQNSKRTQKDSKRTQKDSKRTQKDSKTQK